MLEQSEFTSNPNLEFRDISSEKWRVYVYPGGEEIAVKKPLAVCVTSRYRNYGGNSHRIVDGKGVSHYMPAGWIHIYWKRKKGTKPFLF